MVKIYALETTNHCNANCDYCPRDQMKRSFGLINFEIIEQVFDYCKLIGQDYIALHHMGEPLMHHKIGEIVKLFESGGIHTEFSTNGLLLKKRGIEVLESGLTRLRIAVDYYYDNDIYRKQLKEFLNAAQQYKTHIILHTITRDVKEVYKELTNGLDIINMKNLIENPIEFMKKDFDNWAGSIQGLSTLEKSNECYFLKYNYVIVLWDGRIVPCCMDYDGVNIIGTTKDFEKMKIKEVPLCSFCQNMQFAKYGEWKETL